MHVSRSEVSRLHTHCFCESMHRRYQAWICSLFPVCPRASTIKSRCRILAVSCRCGGKEFEGCLVFDEAHKAKNFNSSKEELSTKVSQAVIKIQVHMQT